MFDDHSYNKRRLELKDIINAAVEKGIINSKKRGLDEAEATEPVKKSKLDGGSVSETRGAGTEPQAAEPKKRDSNSPKSSDEDNIDSHNLWLGLEDDIS